MGEPIRVYYASGGDHEPGHVLLVGDVDLARLRVLQSRAASCFALQGAPDSVGWMEPVGRAVEARTLRRASEDLQDLEDRASSASGGFVQTSADAVEEMEDARSEAWEVRFYATTPMVAQVEWRAKHAYSSNYFAAVNLEEP